MGDADLSPAFSAFPQSPHFTIISTPQVDHIPHSKFSKYQIFKVVLLLQHSHIHLRVFTLDKTLARRAPDAQHKREVKEFFEVYKRLEPKKWVKFKEWRNAEEAKKIVDHSIKLFREKFAH